MSDNQSEHISIFYPYGKPSKKEKVMTILGFLALVLCPILLLLSFVVVEQYKRAIILRMGRIKPHSPSGPGLIFVHPFIDSMIKVDIRIQSINLRPQEVLTKDSVTVTVEAVIYYHVLDPVKCLMNIQNHAYASEMLAVSILRNVLGRYSLTDVQGMRDVINFELKEDIDKGTEMFGVGVERVEMKDVILPIELQKAMAAEAEGRRMAKAKIITAEGEIKAAENLKEASQVISENPKVMLLRYLQTLNFIASDQQTSILFPFPIELPDTL